MAVLSPSAALLLVWVLQRGARIVPLYPLFTVAVIGSAVLGGLLPGLIAVGLSLVYIYLVFAPHYIPMIGQTSARLSVAAFGAVGVLVSIIVGALRNSEMALRESGDRYRSLFESIDEGFCVIEMVFDENGTPNDWRFLEGNPAFERHTGLENATGKTIRELVSNVESRWLEIYGRVAVTGQATRFVEFSHAFNRWFDLYAFRVGEPKQHRVAVLFNNITERKRTEEALIRSEKLASVGRMAATIAHEINNPLAAVVNVLYIAKTNADSPDIVRHSLDMAESELRRVTQITRQALGFYRESIAPTQLVVNEVLDSAIDLLQHKIKSKHVNVKKQYESDLPIVGVAGELRQVFSNMLSNSIDAVENEGIISVRASAGKAFNNAHRCVRIRFADNGKGIPPSARQHIFEPFYTTKESVGTGLGLWVSKQIVEKHNGSIRFHSSIDGSRRGTVFSIVLPARAEGNLNSA